MELPACGLYRTTQPIGGIPAERLVYFHNHGDPGPGIYLPKSWRHNRAQFDKTGVTLSDPSQAIHLAPLPREGFYVVLSEFWCCEKRCRQFQPDELVQLGYNREARPILFLPEVIDGQIALPEMGTRVDSAQLAHLNQLKVRQSRSGQSH